MHHQFIKETAAIVLRGEVSTLFHVFINTFILYSYHAELFFSEYTRVILLIIAQSAEAIEDINCTSAEGEDPSHNECPRYDTKQSDGEVPVMLGLCGMRSAPSLLLLPGLHWPGGVAPDRALSMG